ncbi:MAG: hypothetical protein KDC98_06005 [Planctomycetes bacterium]|nr:hypothetical protein [Planctomycetota bacterium]
MSRVIVGAQSVLLAVFVIGYLLGGQPAIVPGDHSLPVAPERPPGLRQVAMDVGPWGRLAVAPMLIQSSAALASLVVHDYTGEGRWRFPGDDVVAVNTFYSEVGLGADDLELLARHTVFDTAADETVTTPPIDWLIDLPAERRQVLYGALHARGAYALLDDPYTFQGGSFDDWTRRSGLLSATRELLRKLVYLDNGILTIADLHAVYEKVRDPAERIKVERTLTRTTGLQVQLQVDEGEDVAPLIRYWGVRGREDTVAPLLEALADRPGGGSIDIVFLMPRFARARLNSYLPVMEYYLTAEQFTGHDCKWTALNFFNDGPDVRFEGEEGGALSSACTAPIDSPTQFGDITFLLDVNGNVVHAMVQVAADLVFTKNGAAPYAPFVLAIRDDVVKSYAYFGCAATVHRRLAIPGVTQGYALPRTR